MNPAQNVPKFPDMSGTPEPEQAIVHAASSKTERIRAIDEEIDKLLEESRRSLTEASVYLEELRAQGFLPVRKQARRF